MKLTIGIITFNRKSEVVRAIRSFINQMTTDLELIIIDNHSTDGTRESVENILQLSEIQYLYFYEEKNLGVAGGRNKIFKNAKGKYIFILDDDAVIEKGSLFTNLCSYMDKHQEISIAGVKIYEPETDNYLVAKLLPGKDVHETSEAMSYIGAAHIIRKEDFKELNNMYPQNLLFGSEELYSSLYARKIGKAISYFPFFSVNHMPSKINRYVDKERSFNFLINTYIIRLLSYPKWMRPFLWIKLMLRYIKNGLFTFVWLKKHIDTLNERYCPDERINISYKTIKLLCKKFSFNHLF